MASKTRARQLSAFLTPAKLLRLVVVTLAAVFLAWLTIVVGIANQGPALAPEAILRFAPFDAGAKAELAETRLREGAQKPNTVNQAERNANAALLRDPTLVSAWRSLAMVADLRGNRSEATQLFRFTERLSRRDPPTQLWLIEERVAANDIPGALRHYDIALRTSPRSGEILLPVLVAATAEDAVIEPLIRLMLTNPPWGSDLIGRFTVSAPSAANLARLMEGIARVQPLPQSVAMSTIVSRLVNEGKFEAAWRIHQLIRKTGPNERFLRNGSLEATEFFSPFDWQLESGADKAAEPVLLEERGEGPALRVRARVGYGGLLARQLLILPPGMFRVSADIGPVPDAVPAKLYWSVSCASDPSNTLVESIPRLADQRSTLRAGFRVPTENCSAQWLSLNLRSNPDAEGVAAWVDTVKIQQVGS